MAGGFEVDPNGLVEVAGTVADQVERVRGYVKRLRGTPGPSADLLGEYAGVDAAYGRFLDAWVEEFELTSAALAESAGRLRDSAEAYVRTDEGRFGAAQPR